MRSDEDTIEEGEFEAEGASDDEVEGESGSSSGTSSTDEEERLQRHVSVNRVVYLTPRGEGVEGYGVAYPNFGTLVFGCIKGDVCK